MLGNPQNGTTCEADSNHLENDQNISDNARLKQPGGNFVPKVLASYDNPIVQGANTIHFSKNNNIQNVQYLSPVIYYSLWTYGISAYLLQFRAQWVESFYFNLCYIKILGYYRLFATFSVIALETR